MALQFESPIPYYFLFLTGICTTDNMSQPGQFQYSTRLKKKNVFGQSVYERKTFLLKSSTSKWLHRRPSEFDRLWRAVDDYCNTIDPSENSTNFTLFAKSFEKYSQSWTLDNHRTVHNVQRTDCAPRRKQLSYHTSC